MSRPTRQRARASPTAVAAIVFAALAAAALRPAAAGAASVRVVETGPPDSGERATLIFQAAPAEANALTVALKAQEADGARYTLRDLGAELTAGPGCSGGGVPGSELTCVVSRSRPPTCPGGHYCTDPGRIVRLSFALADGSDSFDASALPADDGGGGSFVVEVEGGDGADTLLTGATRDEIDPGPGGDSVHSAEGDDYVDAGASPDAPDLIDLGAGRDEVSYLAARAPVTIAVNGVADDGAAGEGDNVLAAESMLGSRGADTLIGSDNTEPTDDYGFTERLLGCGGGDVLIGNGGNDSLRLYDLPCGGPETVPEDVALVYETASIEGGSGNDEIWAGSGADVADGGPGEDSFYMLGGNDRASGGPGRDRINGGDDADRLRGGRDRDRIYPGYLESWSDQLDEAKDRIDCGESRRDRAIHVERQDQTERCERVQRLPNGWFTSGDLKLKGEATAARSQRQAGTGIVVRIKVKAKETLSAWASGEITVNPTYKLRPKRIELDADETGTLRLKPKPRAEKRIAEALKRGKVPTAKLTVKLTDPDGNRETEKLRVRLRR